MLIVSCSHTPSDTLHLLFPRQMYPPPLVLYWTCPQFDRLSLLFCVSPCRPTVCFSVSGSDRPVLAAVCGCGRRRLHYILLLCQTGTAVRYVLQLFKTPAFIPIRLAASGWLSHIRLPSDLTPPRPRGKEKQARASRKPWHNLSPMSPQTPHPGNYLFANSYLPSPPIHSIVLGWLRDFGTAAVR